MGELTILHYEGTKTITWDMDNDDDIKAVQIQFDTLIGKGFSAHRINPGEEGGDKIDHFDRKAEKILMFPILSGGG